MRNFLRFINPIPMDEWEWRAVKEATTCILWCAVLCGILGGIIGFLVVNFLSK